MSAWRTIPIRETYIGLYDGPHATPKPADDGPVFLGIGNIAEDGHLDLSNVRHIAEEDLAAWTKRVTPQAGDIVFTYEATLNRYAIIPEGFRGCLGRRLALIRPNPAVVNTRWLHHYFFGQDWRATISANTLAGATVERVPLTKFPDFPIQLPPLAEQNRIASILSAYDDLIENNTRRIAILEEMARRIYEEWFVRFRFPGHEKVRMVESELGLMPEGWEVRPLGQLAEITMGLSPKGDTYNEQGDGIPLVNGPVEFGERFTKKIKWTTSVTKLCKADDLIVCVRGSTTGKYVKSDGAYCLGRGVCSISSKYQSFIDQLFHDQLPILLGQTSGSTFPSWTGPQLKSHPVLNPPEALISLFDSHVAPMKSAVFSFSRKNRNLRTTRDLLLPKLISGELDVSHLPEPEAMAA